MLPNFSIQQPSFAISSHLQEQAWMSNRTHSSQWAQWNSYINQISLQTVLPWLRSEINSQAALLFEDWARINGSSVQLGQKSFVLIPDLSIDRSEIRVPQFWVDDTDHAGDYYFAMQVEPDDSWLQLWGYTTHRQLKAIGEYDSRDRCYSLAMENLILDINVFSVVQLLYPDEPTRFEAQSV
ncbi:DUF1822 family protein [Leptolyngbya sp. GGD]|uniref:DUF1822 family protein n=1 Tax=Leptolyngbya sp. GGD TaxID=2997907 RepID=UPI00227B7BD9|nr:DUF1822 family protein [Leptolyngbya sp. GGD]MCY6493823.1 DUF1822 family protein [Leptolyngbya sp. GGD]